MCFAFTMLGLQVFTPFGGLFNAGQIEVRCFMFRVMRTWKDALVTKYVSVL